MQSVNSIAQADGANIMRTKTRNNNMYKKFL